MRGLVETSVVSLEHISTENQLTDMFTKPLDGLMFESLRKLLVSIYLFDYVLKHIYVYFMSFIHSCINFIRRVPVFVYFLYLKKNDTAFSYLTCLNLHCGTIYAYNWWIVTEFPSLYLDYVVYVVWVFSCTICTAHTIISYVRLNHMCEIWNCSQLLVKWPWTWIDL